MKAGARVLAYSREWLFKIARSHFGCIRTEEQRESAAKQKEQKFSSQAGEGVLSDIGQTDEACGRLVRLGADITRCEVCQCSIIVIQCITAGPSWKSWVPTRSTAMPRRPLSASWLSR